MKKLVALLALSTAASFAYAEQFVFPAKEQSPEQQATDEKACDDWASNQVGTTLTEINSQISAAKSATTPGGQAQASAGAGGGGALRGAAIGSALGHAAGSDNRTEAAAVGAVIGASRANRRSAEANAAQQEAQQQAATQASVGELEAQRSDFYKARGTCLTGKGYSVSDK